MQNPEPGRGRRIVTNSQQRLLSFLFRSHAETGNPSGCFLVPVCKLLYIILSRRVGISLLDLASNSWPSNGLKLCLLFHPEQTETNKQKAPSHWLSQLVNYLKPATGSIGLLFTALVFSYCFIFSSREILLLLFELSYALRAYVSYFFEHIEFFIEMFSDYL